MLVEFSRIKKLLPMNKMAQTEVYWDMKRPEEDSWAKGKWTNGQGCCFVGRAISRSTADATITCSSQTGCTGEIAVFEKQ